MKIRTRRSGHLALANGRINVLLKLRVLWDKLRRSLVHGIDLARHGGERQRQRAPARLRPLCLHTLRCYRAVVLLAAGRTASLVPASRECMRACGLSTWRGASQHAQSATHEAQHSQLLEHGQGTSNGGQTRPASPAPVKPARSAARRKSAAAALRRVPPPRHAARQLLPGALPGAERGARRRRIARAAARQEATQHARAMAAASVHRLDSRRAPWPAFRAPSGVRDSDWGALRRHVGRAPGAPAARAAWPANLCPAVCTGWQPTAA